MNHDQQCTVLLKALKKRSLTKVDILKLGILNGGGRIHDLRQQDYNIITIMTPIKTRRGMSVIAKYQLKRPHKLRQQARAA